MTTPYQAPETDSPCDRCSLIGKTTPGPVVRWEGRNLHAHCVRDIDYAARQQHGTDYRFDGDVVRWNSNDSVPPADTLAAFVVVENCTRYEMEQSAAARDAETAAFLDAYRKANRQPSDEELYEMRAAFGEGETVVNVITGRITQL